MQDKAARKQIKELQTQIKALTGLLVIVAEELITVGGSITESNIGDKVAKLNVPQQPKKEKT